MGLALLLAVPPAPGVHSMTAVAEQAAVAFDRAMRRRPCAVPRTLDSSRTTKL